jgi:hypothetical protein
MASLPTGETMKMKMQQLQEAFNSQQAFIFGLALVATAAALLTSCYAVGIVKRRRAGGLKQQQQQQQKQSPQNGGVAEVTAARSSSTGGGDLPGEPSSASSASSGKPSSSSRRSKSIIILDDSDDEDYVEECSCEEADSMTTRGGRSGSPSLSEWRLLGVES